MSKRKSKTLSRRHFLGGTAVAVAVGGCSSSNGGNSSAEGGQSGTAYGTGGADGLGGGYGSGGTSPIGSSTGASGGASSGGQSPLTNGGGTGGQASGGTGGSGGAGGNTGGSGGGGTTGSTAGGTSPAGGGTSGQSTGGGATGGQSTSDASGGQGDGGASTGGTQAGGTSSGGASSGGTSSGGASSGGTSTGGTSTGGTSTGTGAGGNNGGEAGGTQITGGTNAGGQGPAGGQGGQGGAGGSTGTEPALVALVRGNDWAQAVLDAIEMAGGLAGLESGMSVLIKPNVISGVACPETTSPEVIRGAILAAKARGAGSIVVAEDGFASETLGNMRATGIQAVCDEEGAEAVSLENSPTTRLTPAGAWAGGIDFYQRVLDADYVINMPVCKSHGIAFFSMALKNWYGCFPKTGSLRPHDSLPNRIVDAHLGRQEQFVILDATKALVTGGPQIGTNGEVVESKVVVASRDAIAADIAGLCIHKQYGTRSDAVFNQDVWEQPQIKRALELQFPGWLTSKQNFPYAQKGVDDHVDIMAWRDA